MTEPIRSIHANHANHDGCAEFDEQLMELAVQPLAAPELEAHLAICERCRRAHEQYRDTVRIVGAALTLRPAPPARPAARNRGSFGRRAATALLTSLVAAAAILWFWPSAEPALRPSMSVHPEQGTTVQLFGPDRAVIESGTSTFVIAHSDMVVETPAGRLSCDDCEFTVEISECRNCPPGERPACEPGPVCVTLFVAAGLVGSDIREQSAPLGPGQILTWSVPSSPVAALTHFEQPPE